MLVYVNDSNIYTHTHTHTHTHTLTYIFVISVMCYIMCIMYDFIFYF